MLFSCVLFSRYVLCFFFLFFFFFKQKTAYELRISDWSSDVCSSDLARSGIIESMLARLTASVTRVRWQLTILVSSVTVLSALVKNIGALAILIPSALRMARKSGASPSVFLMPMSFGSLLGGLMTLVGTSHNIIVSREIGRAHV